METHYLVALIFLIIGVVSHIIGRITMAIFKSKEKLLLVEKRMMIFHTEIERNTEFMSHPEVIFPYYLTIGGAIISVLAIILIFALHFTNNLK